jgi:molecular chaperone GrpE
MEQQKTEHPTQQPASEQESSQNQEGKSTAQALHEKPQNASPENGHGNGQPTATEGQETADSRQWEEKYQTLHDQYLRLAADFENYRKRQLQEHEAARKYGIENTFRELMPTLDNLERATGSLNENSDPKVLYQSFRLMYNQLLDAFANLGMKKMETVGKPFDPNFHEAVAQVDNADFPDQAVVQEYQSGFMLGDRVLRPAMVVVNSRAGAAPATAETSENPFCQVNNNSGFTPEKDSK